MKNIFILLLISTGLIAKAQFYIGPELGVNLLPVENNQLGNNYQLGFHGGLNTEYRFNDYFSINSGVYFTQKKQSELSFDTSNVEIFGFDLESLIPGVNFEEYSSTKSFITQSYIQIPILASYTYKNFSASAGPFVGFMIKAWTKEETSSNIPALQIFDIDSLDPTGFLSLLIPPGQSTSFNETSVKTNLRSLDFGFKTMFTFHSDNFAVNLSYLYSFPDYRIDRGELDLKRHSYFQASINYNFKFGKQKDQSRY